MAESAPPSERRRDARHLACFPAYVELPSGERETSIIADLSTTGALLLVRQKADVGDAVRLELFIAVDTTESRAVHGRILRVEPLPENRASPWFFQAAVEFDEPITLYESEIDAMMERTAKLGLRR